MNAERWEIIAKLYHSASELEPARRSVFLEEHCRGDEGLRREVESLLNQDISQDGLLERVAEHAAVSGRRLPPGARLGPYQILAPLGAGGMGEVHRANDTRLDRQVAIKVLAEHLAQDPQALARFEREAKAVAALSHPNILALFDIGSDQGISYAVTELLQGETLRACLARAAVPWRKAVEIAIAVADGIAAAHSKGLIHRDLKPENIFLTTEGQVKILDFGLARWSSKPSTSTDAAAPTETAAGVVMGTAGYMSPEQIRGIGAEAPSDIFSLGCVLYEMVTGQRAFARSTAPDTMAAILHEHPPNMAGSGKQIPSELQAIIERCLEKKPEQRFQAARDLGFALRAVAASSGDTVTAAPRDTRKLLHRSTWAAAMVLLAGGSFFIWRASSAKAIDSLAVLPFVNVGGDPNTEYLSDGITENLINSFSQLPKLRVVPRNRVFRYKGREADNEKIGRELNVRAVLMGKVMQRGDSLNIQAELVDVAADAQLWGWQYSRKLSEIIPLQEEIAKEVAEKLHLRPTGEERKRLTRHYTEDPEAHQLYLKGRYYWSRRTGEALKRAAEYFRQAIDKDPTYALAWSGLSNCYVSYSIYGLLTPRDANPKAKEAAGKALGLDETLAEPHSVLGYIKATYDWDWAGGEREFKRAIQLDPNNAIVHFWYEDALQAMGRLDEAVAEGKQAQESDPLSPIMSAHAGRTQYYARRYDQAAEQLRKTLEMDPNFVRAHLWLAWVYAKVGKPDEAVTECKKAMTVSGDESVLLGTLGHAYAMSGKRAEAQKVLVKLKELSKARYVAPYDLALVYVGLGDKAQALDWLEKAYEDHSHRLIFIKVEPRLDSLRREPRFQELLRRMNLAP